MIKNILQFIQDYGSLQVLSYSYVCILEEMAEDLLWNNKGLDRDEDSGKTIMLNYIAQ